MKDIFIQAIHGKLKIRVTFFSQEDGEELTRKCAPMDFGPSRRAKVKIDRFHLWDYESDQGTHSLALNPVQVKEIIVLTETFNPGSFITWSTTTSPWYTARNWGEHS